MEHEMSASSFDNRPGPAPHRRRSHGSLQQSTSVEHSFCGNVDEPTNKGKEPVDHDKHTGSGKPSACGSVWISQRVYVCILLVVAALLLVISFAGHAPISRATNSCEYLEHDFGTAQRYSWNSFMRPIIDEGNRLIICAAPEAGEAEIEEALRLDLMRRNHGRHPDPNFVNEAMADFINAHGALKKSLSDGDVMSKYTRVLVYREPMDRLARLWLQFFNSDDYRKSWVSANFVQQHRTLDFDLLMSNLESITTDTSLQDPHVWPQTSYCGLNPPHIQYQHMVDVDRPGDLERVFGRYWNISARDFALVLRSTGTEHWTKARPRIRERISRWRDEFTRTYASDLRFYCHREKA